MSKPRSKFSQMLRKFMYHQDEVNRLEPLVEKARARRDKLLGDHKKLMEAKKNSPKYVSEGRYIHSLDKPGAWRRKSRRRP